MENHPTIVELSQFALGNLASLEYELIELHLQQCDTCWDRIYAQENVQGNEDALISMLRESAEMSADLTDTVAATQGLHATSCDVELAVSQRYDLVEKIASGGMGDIWVAYDTVLRREVAIKLLRDSDAPDASSRARLLHERFVRESQIISSLQHPGIPPVYDLGRLGDGRPFLAMKLVRGQTLAARMESDHTSNIDWLLEVFSQVCQTVAFAHSRGVVHRDLKPENIMVGQFGETLVMDWGIAAVASGREEVPVQPKVIIGTPSYMSPEQATGGVCEPRSDVFALGSVLCEMVTGSPVYRGTDAKDLLNRAIAGDVSDAVSRLQQSDADPAIVALAQSCLAVNRYDRPADAEEVAKQVTIYQHSVQARLRAAELERAREQARVAESARRRRTQKWLGVSAVCLVLVTLFAWRIVHRRTQETLSQIHTATAEARRLNDLSGAVTEGARERLEVALDASQRAVNLSLQTSDPAIIKDCQSLRDALGRRVETAVRLEQLQSDLHRAMIFGEGHTVEQRFQNRRRAISRAVAEGRRSSLLFLRFPSFDARREGASTGIPPAAAHRLGLAPPRREGRGMTPDPEEYLSGRATIFRHSHQLEPEYQQCFSDFGVTPDLSVATVVDDLSRLEPADRAMVISGLRIWFLHAADDRGDTAKWLSTLLDGVNSRFEKLDSVGRWNQSARDAMVARDPDAIAAVCEQAHRQMDELSPELLWGIGSFHQRFSGDDWVLRHAQRFNPDSFLINRELARLTQRLRRDREALAYIHSALAVHADYELSLQLARSLLGSGKVDEFEIVRDRCLARYPNDPLVLADWADLMAMHRRAEVLVFYERALEAGYPEPQVLLARIGQLMERAEFHEEAKAAYLEALALPDLPPEHAAELESALARLSVGSDP